MTGQMTKRALAHALGAMLVLGLISCGSDSMSSPSLVIPGGSFIPDFTFVWRNTADTTNTYQFVPDNSNAHSGNLTSDSNETRGGVFSKLTGTYSEHNMNITIQRPGGSVAASGGFTDTDTIKLQFGTTIVTLVRFKG